MRLFWRPWPPGPAQNRSRTITWRVFAETSRKRHRYPGLFWHFPTENRSRRLSEDRLRNSTRRPGSEFPRIATTRPLFNRSSCEIFELCFNRRRSYAAEITEITVEAYTTIIISPESSVTFVGLLQFPIALFMQYAQISLTFTVLSQCQRHILNATLYRCICCRPRSTGSSV